MARPAKEIYTFTALLLKAAKMFKSDPLEYRNLTEEGSMKLIPGIKVSATGVTAGNGSIQCFSYSIGGRDLCYVRGGHAGGKFYTQYYLRFSVGSYRKTDMRYLPVTLPDGAKFRRWVPAIFHNADGSEARKSTNGYLFRRRGYQGRPDVNEASCVYLRDRDGKMIDRLLEDDKTVEGCEDSMRSPVDTKLGYLPGTVGKEAWYESMVAPEYEGEKLWDSATVRMTAARAHSAALKMTAQYPHLKIALYPMLRTQDDVAGVRNGCRFTTRFANPTGSHCLGRNQNLDGTFYFLPHLVVYWTVSSAKAGLNANYSDQLRFVQVFIPPYGNKYLERANANDRIHHETFRWGHEARRGLSRGEVPERVFHTFRCLKSEAAFIDLSQVYQLSRMPATAPDPVVYWPEAKGTVAVVDFSEDNNWGNQNQSYARECQPENILAGIAERELINSLPLC
jgi:hypothetical protein